MTGVNLLGGFRIRVNLRSADEDSGDIVSALEVSDEELFSTRRWKSLKSTLVAQVLWKSAHPVYMTTHFAGADLGFAEGRG